MKGDESVSNDFFPYRILPILGCVGVIRDVSSIGRRLMQTSCSGRMDIYYL